MTVISLTSIPPRFGILQRTLAGLLAQTADIREIRVNIPKSYRRFPEDSFSLPKVPEGIRIDRPTQDYGPATKLLPALKDLEGSDEPIIYCDDDRVTSIHWAQDLIDTARAHPEKCIANSGWDLENLGLEVKRPPSDDPRAIYQTSRRDLRYRMQRMAQTIKKLQGKSAPKPFRTQNFRHEGLLDIMEGCGGVLVKPGFFPKEVFDVPDKLWTVDDIWLSGMAAHNGVRILGHNGFLPNEITGAETDALSNSTIEGLNRQQANLECAEYMRREFGVWPAR